MGLEITGLRERPDASIGGRHWYLLHSKPRNEDLALENLERQGYTTYLPKLNVVRRRKGKLVSRVEPMFPRYLFVSLNTSTDNWAPIRSTIGVSSLVRFGQNPAVVPDDLIKMLMEREDENGVMTPQVKTFSEGEKVRIFEGPFKDYEAVFLARNSSERVLVLLDILGKASKISIHPGNLAKL